MQVCMAVVWDESVGELKIMLFNALMAPNVF